jgi:flagellar biosynthesis GTPase FlhF
MELKRILAKDIRRATEKAVALFGQDVIFVSNSRVNGMTEVIVAVDVAPEPWAEAKNRGDGERFGQALQQSFKALEKGATASSHEAHAADPEDEYAQATSLYEARRQQAKKQAEKSARSERSENPDTATSAQNEHRDYIRGREIVDLVRDELAAIRKEFKLAQRVAAWQSETPANTAVRPLVTALAEASIPVSLRTLLVDHINTMSSLDEATDALRLHLTKSIGEHWAKLPQRGVHAIAGPAGSGKTLMVARLARAAAERKGVESVAVISYSDQRAGAWSQIQMLCSQAGVDCLRANDPETLKMLLAELGQRRLVLIDTPGVQVTEKLEQIKTCSPEIQCHLIMPADASSTTVRKYLSGASGEWHSLMVSRMDEATQPWALLQMLCETPVKLSAGSHSPLPTEGCQVVTANEIVALALRGLAVEPNLVAAEVVDKDDVTVVSAAHALVNRIEKAAHAS